MNELLIIAAIVTVLLLIIILIFIIARKRITKNAPLKIDPAFPESAMQAEESLSPTETNSEFIVESQTNKSSTQSHKVCNDNLPQDFMLRRHAITHLQAMVESNMPIRPTDSVLRRHYDTMINTEVNNLPS